MDKREELTKIVKKANFHMNEEKDEIYSEERIGDLERVLSKIKKAKESFGSNPDLDERIDHLQQTIEQAKERTLLKG